MKWLINWKCPNSIRSMLHFMNTISAILKETGCKKKLHIFWKRRLNIYHRKIWYARVNKRASCGNTTDLKGWFARSILFARLFWRMYLLEEVAQQKLDRLNITKYYEESLIDMEKVKKAEADIEKHKKATAEKWNVWSGKFPFRIQTNLNPASKLNWHCVKWNFLFPVPAKKLFSATYNFQSANIQRSSALLSNIKIYCAEWRPRSFAKMCVTKSK